MNAHASPVRAGDLQDREGEGPEEKDKGSKKLRPEVSYPGIEKPAPPVNYHLSAWYHPNGTAKRMPGSIRGSNGSGSRQSRQKKDVSCTCENVFVGVIVAVMVTAAVMIYNPSLRAILDVIFLVKD